MLTDDPVGELHYIFTAATNQASIKQLLIPVQFEELAISFAVVIVLHPFVKVGFVLRANVNFTRRHLFPRLTQHFNVCPVSTPDKMVFRVGTKILIDVKPASKVGAHTQRRDFKQTGASWRLF
ncbi:Uncharacterised protein [Citrobacter werkmanii]|nr:Uncharacterised protein [Citrobacter werkmanii]